MSAYGKRDGTGGGAEVIKHILSFSGGKDSTAMLLIAVQRAINRGHSLTVVAADTGHEHPLTYQYWDYISKEVHPITVVKADFSERIFKKREYIRKKWPEKGVSQNQIDRALSILYPTGVPFLDLCMWKGRFPSVKARFCTDELKAFPIQEQIYLPALNSGQTIVSWQGIRRDESPARRNAKLLERKSEKVWFYRPLINWTAEDVFFTHERFKIKPNPLYKLGMSRVGCMPCIMARKSELSEIGKRFPEEVARVKEWERIVSQASLRESATFLAYSDIPCAPKDTISAAYLEYGIEYAINWSKTARGGRQFDLFYDDDPLSCSSQYGLCE